jgi:hypothetical protein
MTFSDVLSILSLFILFIGLGLLVYLQLFGLLLRFHFKFFPMLAKRYDRVLGIEFREPVNREWLVKKQESEPEYLEPFFKAADK